jgi:glutamate dehydrogenase/leucine dehydrogenase
MGQLAEMNPHQFADHLRSLGRRRAYLVYESDSRTFQPSHPALQQLADRLASVSRGADAHEAIFFEVGRETGALMAAFIHKTLRGQAQGGLRNQPYETVAALMRDGLRLSRSMTHKNALAGLWWGGGKGLIARGGDDVWHDPGFRRRLYREYGAFVSSLRGCYVTAEDAGTSPLDIAEVFRTTRFLTCIPPDSGGSGNPSRMTALGVLCGMEAALHFLGVESLADKKIVLQGTGNVGSEMIPLLLHHGVRQIVASEICEERRAALLDNFSDHPVEIRPTRPGDEDILAEPCDVLSPCALGGVLGPKTIPSIQAKIVCGPANNQLVDEQRDATRRHLRPRLPREPDGHRGLQQRAVRRRERRPHDPAPPRSLVAGRHLPHHVEGARARAKTRRDPGVRGDPTGRRALATAPPRLGPPRATDRRIPGRRSLGGPVGPKAPAPEISRQSANLHAPATTRGEKLGLESHRCDSERDSRVRFSTGPAWRWRRS